jgi:hypothetical protein
MASFHCFTPQNMIWLQDLGFGTQKNPMYFMVPTWYPNYDCTPIWFMTLNQTPTPPPKNHLENK